MEHCRPLDSEPRERAMSDRMFAAVRRRRVALLCAGVALVVACGGTVEDDDDDDPGPPASAPGGLYVGYYAEDPVNNPEDPTLGVLHLALPANDAAFSGAMFFTYVGCQSSNVGTISGNRSGNTLSGNWSGTIDGLAQSGNYGGTYNANSGVFSGTYTVAGGKQARDLSPCISYFIAANGTWELLPVGRSVPDNFDIDVSGTTVQWSNPNNTALTLVAVLDEAEAAAGQASAARFQAVEAGGLQSLNLSAVTVLVPGRRYVVTVATADAQRRRLAAGSIVVRR
jgi:hypothetical protein